MVAIKSTLTYLGIALYLQFATALKHHLVLTNDHRVFFSVSSFGYLQGGRLDVIVQNLTLSPDPGETGKISTKSLFGLVLVKSRSALMNNAMAVGEEREQLLACMLDEPHNYLAHDIITLGLLPNENKVSVMCRGDSEMPTLTTLPAMATHEHHSHAGYRHAYNKRAVAMNQSIGSSSPLNDLKNDPSLVKQYNPYKDDEPDEPEMRRVKYKLHKCPNTNDLPLIVAYDSLGRKTYSFNFTMTINKPHEEGFYYVTFHNCHGSGLLPIEAYDLESLSYTPTKFNLSMLIHETNMNNNYLSAGLMPLPQMYFMLSVMFFLIGCVWVNFIARQKESARKIHHLMTVLVFAKACSLLFHGINFHYIAIYGKPVVTWAYLYYATRTVKGSLFFLTLVLIGSGWSFIKHILSEEDKNMILVIVTLQIVAHTAEIMTDESTEGEPDYDIWAALYSMVDLFSCVAILFPISWSMRHLQEASRTDGKAAINLRKLELFKRFYIISTVYIYVTRIVTFLFLSTLSYKYSWVAEFQSEFVTLIYFIVTGYYFQPMPTNPYLLLSSDQADLEEDILFSVDSLDQYTAEQHQLDNLEPKKKTGDRASLLQMDDDDDDGDDSPDRQVMRRNVEEIV